MNTDYYLIGGCILYIILVTYGSYKCSEMACFYKRPLKNSYSLNV